MTIKALEQRVATLEAKLAEQGGSTEAISRLAKHHRGI